MELSSTFHSRSSLSRSQFWSESNVTEIFPLFRWYLRTSTLVCQKKFFFFQFPTLKMSIVVCNNKHRGRGGSGKNAYELKDYMYEAPLRLVFPKSSFTRWNFTPCLSVQMISMSTWFQAITWVISIISKVYDIVDVRSLKNCENDHISNSSLSLIWKSSISDYFN